MNRRLLLGISSALTLAALSTVSYRWFGAKPVEVSEREARARRMWVEAGASTQNQSSERAHELKALAVSLKENPDHAPILVRMAQLTREQGNNAEAMKRLQEAVQADPKNREARLELGKALFESGDVDGAIRQTQSLLELEPSNVDGLYNLGAIYGNLGQDSRAREYWEKVVAISPDSESGHRAKDGLKQLAR